jgi:ATP-binding cassette, subfamily F, member 3
MTTLLQCFRLTHRAGTKPLFDKLDLTINSGDRIGLVGHNGSGKSTLFSLLSGAEPPEAGEIARAGDLMLETVEQFIDPGLRGHTLADALAAKLPVEERAFSEYKVAMLLARLGFVEREFEHRVGDLSGGQQNRLMFARAVINSPNLILFDEPTNHLDLRTLLYFEDFLRGMAAAYILISHDRQFLDAVTDRTLFLRDQHILSFQLPYSEARARLAEQDEADAAHREVEEKHIKSLRASAKRLAIWGRVYDNEKLAAKAKSMEKRIEKLEQQKTFVSRGSGLSLTLDVQQARANRMLQIENQPILAPDGATELFHCEDFFIRPGDRVALLGRNGAGKTTLIKQIMTHYRTDPQGDVIRFNPRCEIGYYDQELQNLDGNRTMVETLSDRCRGSESQYKATLIKAGVPYLDLDKQVGVLSGGEKARLIFLIIKLNQPNFLILDEPTNHIDIQGKEELEIQILETDATVLVTSHDRRFVDNIAERYVWIRDGKLTEINDPREFYEWEREFQSNATRQDPKAPDRDTGTVEAVTDDAVLARIVALETLLGEDLGRKPRFQKPRLQAEWRAELAELNRKL